MRHTNGVHPTDLGLHLDLSATDRLAEEVVYQRLQGWLKEHFQEADLLAPGPEVEHTVRGGIHQVVQGYCLEAAVAGTPGVDDTVALEARMANRVLGAGYLAPLVADPSNEEVQVIGGRVRVFRNGRWQRVDRLAPEDAETMRVIQRWIGPLGAHLDTASPSVECTLDNGLRLTAVIPPQTDHVTLVLRRHVVRHHRLAELGTLPPDAVQLVEQRVRAGASVIVAGPVASGKTTTLRCVMAVLDPEVTVCTIEDARELALPHPAVIPQYARRPNIEGTGGISYRELVRIALRLRPDVLAVGECRGAEGLDLLLAASTGHQCFTSIHARSPRGALRQLATFARLAPEGVSPAAISEMIAEHFSLVLLCQKERDGTRGISHVFEITGLADGGTTVAGSDLWALDRNTGELRRTGVQPRWLSGRAAGDPL
jgi:pilus assembly protein CpaF